MYIYIYIMYLCVYICMYYCEMDSKTSKYDKQYMYV